MGLEPHPAEPEAVPFQNRPEGILNESAHYGKRSTFCVSFVLRLTDERSPYFRIACHSFSCEHSANRMRWQGQQRRLESI